MEIKITSKQIFTVLLVLAWIIFVGLSIEAGGFLCNAFFTLVLNPEGAKHFWKLVDLSAVYNSNKTYFITISSLMVIVAILKSVLFYRIIVILSDKEFNIEHPFNIKLTRFISLAAYISFGIGLFANWGATYVTWMASKDIPMPTLQELRFDGFNVWLFMGVILFVIAQIFKRGVAIQAENDLTV